MANGMTVDQLYEAFMDIDEFGDPTDPSPFAEDVFGFFGKDTLGGYTQEEWAKQYGTYLPTWDPSQVNLAGRERDLDFTTAMDTLKTTQAATDRVYATEMDTLSTTLGKELSKGREIAGGIGLRLGELDVAIQDTIATTGSKAKDFGDRTRIAGQMTDDKYNVAMVDAALDFEKTERDEKEEFYDRTMAAIMRLMDTGAFDDPEDLCPGEVECDDGSCGGLNGCDCPEHADKPICLSDVGIGDQPPGNEGIADAAYCTQICTPFAGMESGGMTCYDSCLGTPTIGGGGFDPHILDWQDRAELEAGCDGTLEYNYTVGDYVCIPGSSTPSCGYWYTYRDGCCRHNTTNECG